MSQVQRTANHCDICGHEWLPQSGVAYSHCTSGKCRSRKWDRGEAEKVKAPVSKTGHAGSTPASPAKLAERIATGAEGKALASRAVKVLLEKRPHLKPVCPSCGALNGMHQKGCKAK